MIEVIYPNPEFDPKNEKSLIQQAEDALMSNTQPGQKEITLGTIADNTDVSVFDIYGWMNEDPQFQNDLKQYIDLHRRGVFSKEYLDNRADAVILATIFNEAKKRNGT